MLKRRMIRGATLVAALLLAHLAVTELVLPEKRETAENAQSAQLLENVLAENATGEAYPNLYASGEVTEKELPEKVVFLTFDDGPSRNTEKILDTLAEYDAKATFFLIGENLTEKGVETAKRAVAEGHMLGLHTDTHEYSEIYGSVDAFLADYEKLANRFLECFGECPAIYRFPGGSYSSYINPIREELKKEMERRGFLGYDWNVSGEDSVGTPTAASIKKHIFDEVYACENPIILLHDSPCSNLTAEVLPDILKRLTEEGYSFMTLQYREPYLFPW